MRIVTVLPTIICAAILCAGSVGVSDTRPEITPEWLQSAEIDDVMFLTSSSVFIAPISKTALALCVAVPYNCPDRDNSLVLQAYDMEGKPAWQALLTNPRGAEEKAIYYPTFAVAPNGDIHVFWCSERQFLYGAIVSSRGETVRRPGRIGGLLTGMPFLASIRNGKIYGIGPEAVPHCASALPACIRVVMDLKHKVLETKKHNGFSVERGDAVVADESGNIHMLFRDLYVPQRGLEAVIAYRVFGSDGEVGEKTEIARVSTPWGIPPALGITLDPQGTVHIYYTRPTKVVPGDRKASTYEVEQVEKKPDKPAKGPRSGVVLALELCGTSLIDNTGKKKEMRKSVLGQSDSSP